MTFYLTFVHIIFSSVSVAEWEIAAHSVDHMFSLYLDYLYYQLFSRFGFEGWSWVLIASVPDLCILFT